MSSQARKGTSVQDFLSATNGVEGEFNVRGVTPEALGKHDGAAEYNILGISPAEVASLHSGVQFNFRELEDSFKTLCTDYGMDLSIDTKSYALEFAVKMIYEVGPASRQVKKGQADKRWKFRFVDTTKEKAEKYTAVFVASYKTSEPPMTTPTVVNGQMILTMKQASLLAVRVFCMAIEVCAANGIFLMTPLCGAIFSKNSLEDLAMILTRSNEDKAIGRTLKILTCSCQSGGHYLEESDATVAVIAAVCATRTMNDKKVRSQIIVKTYKQYASMKKPFNDDLYMLLGVHATGGVPIEHSSKALIEKYESTHKPMPPMSMYNAAYSSGVRTVAAMPQVTEEPKPSTSKNQGN
ncbi:nucleocapsid protein [Anopheles triannulatus orthophasmavirus]|uniref:Nucleocapsid protein n=3 Tax=root TaxID=1 RepID=A0A481XUC0_9VIRU|nr:nucleocapsid protein [Anopheles triannulatus orthophasmavirus]QBK47220.1 nucleocapsid protein [Anopheles triannulatus orthophasmavirus]